MFLLILAAVLPVLVIGLYIYKKDIHREPTGLLMSLFVKGILICIPVIIVEVLVGGIFNTDNPELPFLRIFINVLFGIALVEEGFKWLVTYFSGYKSREFDEVYDVIVYAVFASLGFACLENVGYVFDGGMYTAVMRAIFSIPGHTCFGVLMGYYMSKAKVNEMNGKKDLASTNKILSIVVPTLFHGLYDTLLSTDIDMCIIIFFIVDIIMVIYCISIIRKMSKVQVNITNNINQGYIIRSNEGTINYVNPNMMGNFSSCPICGKTNQGYNYCSGCGFKLK